MPTLFMVEDRQVVCQNFKGEKFCFFSHYVFNSVNSEINPICPFLTLLGAHPTLHFSS